jgi:iron complex outermembrane receptor protein
MARYPQIFALSCPPLLALAFLTATSAPGHTEELGAPPDQPLRDELELLKEEETVSIASRYEQPISQAPSNV